MVRFTWASASCCTQCPALGYMTMVVSASTKFQVPEWPAAFEETFNFPSVRLASQGLVIIKAGDMKPERFSQGALAEWDHSAWDRREVIHAGPDKVHIDTRFTRYRKDGSVIGGFDSIYVVNRENGKWGVKIRSSYAP